MKRKLKFPDYKDCLEFAPLERKINYLERKIKTSIDCLKGHQKDFVIKNYFEETIRISVESLKASQKKFVNKIILKEQQRFKSKEHDVFTEVINKIALSSNDDKIMQSIDIIETFSYGTSKDLIWKKEKIKRDNTIEQYENAKL